MVRVLRSTCMLKKELWGENETRLLPRHRLQTILVLSGFWCVGRRAGSVSEEA